MLLETFEEAVWKTSVRLVSLKDQVIFKLANQPGRRAGNEKKKMGPVPEQVSVRPFCWTVLKCL